MKDEETLAWLFLCIKWPSLYSESPEEPSLEEMFISDSFRPIQDKWPSSLLTGEGEACSCLANSETEEGEDEREKVDNEGAEDLLLFGDGTYGMCSPEPESLFPGVQCKGRIVCY